MKLGTAFVLIVSLVVAAGSALAGIINVPSDQPTIQAGIDAALTGDTVLVADGHYYERINFLGKAITVSSGWLIDGDTAHIANTIIDGDTTVLGVTDTASTVRFENGEGRSSVLSGFTLQNGYGTDHYSHRCGGAILCFGASPTIDRCKMTQNTGGDMLAFGGGQPLVGKSTLAGGFISENYLGGPVVESCFVGAVVGSRYGSFRVNRSQVTTVIADSYDAYIQNGVVVVLPFDSTRSNSKRLRLRASEWDPSLSETFVAEDAAVYSFCVMRIADCEILGNARSADEGMLIADRCIIGRSECGFYGYDSLRYCVVRGPLILPASEAIVQHSTVLGGVITGYAHFVADSSLIISASGPAIRAVSDARIWANCSNFWSPDSSWLAGSPILLDTSNIVSADPQFCDTANGNYGIRSTSPCAPANNSCGALIGAMPVACEPGIILAPIQYPTIQAAIDAAYDGDTVLIEDGVYYERISFKGKKITVASRYILDSDTNHIANTIIDGDTTVLGVSDTGSVVRCVSGEDTTTVLSGLTIRHGIGTLISESRHGGGIFGTSPISVIRCNVTMNSNDGVWLLTDIDSGPARLLRSKVRDNSGPGVMSPRILIDSSVVADNTADGIQIAEIGTVRSSTISGNAGNGICGPGYLFVIECDLESNGLSGVVAAIGDIANCRVRFNAQDGIRAAGNEVVVGNCEVTANLRYGVLVDDSWGLQIDHTRIAENQSSGIRCTGSLQIFYSQITGNARSGGSAIEMSGSLFLKGSVVAANRTSLAGSINLSSCYSFAMENCLVVDNLDSPAIACVAGQPPELRLTCTDIFGNEGGDWVGCIADQATQNNNFSADPLFCDSSFATLAVHTSSPCLAANSPCGQTVGNVTLGACQGLQITNVDVPPDMQHVIVSNPVIYWSYSDDMARPQTQFEIAVGSDTNWTYAECWNPAPVSSSDTFVTYGGSPLTDSTTYYFRLRLHNGAFWTDWYDGSFHTNGAPSAPFPAGPYWSTPTGPTPTLSVQNSHDPENDPLTYQFAIYSDSMLTQLVVSDSNIPEGHDPDTTLWTVTPPLEENRWYYWHARAFDGYEYSEWSWTSHFIVNSANEPPSAPVLLSPPDSTGLPVFTRRPTLYWTISRDPDPMDWARYRAQVSLNESFTLAMQFDSLWTNSMIMPDSLPYGTHLWWRVWAVDRNGGEALCPSVKDFWIWVPGDIDHSHSCDIGDLTAIVDFLFFGAEITPRFVGDVNSSCSVDISDLSYLIDYLFFGGPAPREGC